MGDHGGPKTEISFAGRFASSAIAACLAEICTIPLDTAKVRLQLQKKAVSGDAVALPKYRGMLGTVSTIAREEGLTALWKGIVPGLHRQCVFGGLRIGLYEPVKALYVGENFVGDIPLSKKILAGLTTGALAITVANPTDLVKVRLQSEGKLPPGVPRRYSGALNAYSTIVRQEGVRALWTGIGPNIARNAIINAAELASYDQVKQTILKIPGFSDNVFTHLLSGMGAGFFAVCIGSPVDVVKSRMMGDSAYKSTLDCFFKTLKNDLRELPSQSLTLLPLLPLPTLSLRTSGTTRLETRLESCSALYHFLCSWATRFLQRFHSKFWSARLMECDHVFNIGTG